MKTKKAFTALTWLFLILSSYLWCVSGLLPLNQLYKKESLGTNVSVRVDKPRQDDINSAVGCSVYCVEDHRCIFFQVNSYTLLEKSCQPTQNVMLVHNSAWSKFSYQSFQDEWFFSRVPYCWVSLKCGCTSSQPFHFNSVLFKTVLQIPIARSPKATCFRTGLPTLRDR